MDVIPAAIVATGPANEGSSDSGRGHGRTIRSVDFCRRNNGPLHRNRCWFEQNFSCLQEQLEA